MLAISMPLNRIFGKPHPHGASSSLEVREVLDTHLVASSFLLLGY